MRSKPQLLFIAVVIFSMLPLTSADEAPVKVQVDVGVLEGVLPPPPTLPNEIPIINVPGTEALFGARFVPADVAAFTYRPAIVILEAGRVPAVVNPVPVSAESTDLWVQFTRDTTLVQGSIVSLEIVSPFGTVEFSATAKLETTSGLASGTVSFEVVPVSAGDYILQLDGEVYVFNPIYKAGATAEVVACTEEGDEACILNSCDYPYVCTGLPDPCDYPYVCGGAPGPQEYVDAILEAVGNLDPCDYPYVCGGGPDPQDYIDAILEAVGNVEPCDYPYVCGGGPNVQSYIDAVLEAVGNIDPCDYPYVCGGGPNVQPYVDAVVEAVGNIDPCNYPLVCGGGPDLCDYPYVCGGGPDLCNYPYVCSRSGMGLNDPMAWAPKVTMQSSNSCYTKMQVKNVQNDYMADPYSKGSAESYDTVILGGGVFTFDFTYFNTCDMETYGGGNVGFAGYWTAPERPRRGSDYTLGMGSHYKGSECHNYGIRSVDAYCNHGSYHVMSMVPFGQISAAPGSGSIRISDVSNVYIDERDTDPAGTCPLWWDIMRLQSDEIHKNAQKLKKMWKAVNYLSEKYLDQLEDGMCPPHWYKMNEGGAKGFRLNGGWDGGASSGKTRVVEGTLPVQAMERGYFGYKLTSGAGFWGGGTAYVQPGAEFKYTPIAFQLERAAYIA